VWERKNAQKAQHDMVKFVPPEIRPLPEYRCGITGWFSDSRCWLDTCPQWAGEEEVETGRRLDLGGRVNRILSEAVVGQEKSIEMIVAAIRSKTNLAPLSMHLVGDNGTGKTLTGGLISKAIFKADNPTGLLYIRGNSYMSSQSVESSSFRKKIKLLVENQLKQCPASIIIVDELQSMHRNTIVVFDQFLDTTFREDYLENGGVDTRKAIFIFISDFGKEGTSINDTPEQLVKRAHEESITLWKGSRTSSLIQNIVPFLPAQPIPAYELVSHLILELFSLPYFKSSHLNLTGINFCTEDQLTVGISKLIWDAMQTGISKLEQYRGIRKLFDQLVVRPVTSSVSTFYEKQKLWEIPKTQPPVDFSLLLCSKGGTQPVTVTVEIPWCTKPQEDSDETLKKGKDEL
jgi:hypothetical protein